MSIPAYVKYIGLTILFVIATVNFTRTTLDVIDSSRRLDEMKNNVAELENEKDGLEEDLEYRKSNDFVEQEARNKLGMVKPGEELFVVEKVLGTETHNTGSDDKKMLKSIAGTNASQWLELFF